jgi:hypothetical protein
VVRSISSHLKGVYNPKAVILHAALLGQACAQCRRFLAAATRRCLGRVAVPVWLIVLTDQRPVIGLVGRYPANDLMGRTLLPRRTSAFPLRAYAVLAPLSGRYSPPEGRFVRVPQPFATDDPKAARATCMH